MKPGCQYRLLLVRHGQAEGNQKGVFLGHHDTGLTDLGRRQVASLGKRLEDESVDLIYTSPLRRARETADMLAEARGLSPSADDRLIEQNYGKWDGLSFSEVGDRFPDDFRAWCDGDPEIGPTGGESLRSVADRVARCHQALSGLVPAGGTMLWVSHAGALQCLLCGALGIPLRNLWPFMLRTGSLTELEFHDFGARLMRLSWY